MLGVDGLKSLHARATDLLCGRRIVFHHIPKCGGTSVGRSLRRAFILSQGTVKPHESQRAFDTARRTRQTTADVYDLREMMLLYNLHADCRCVSAHVAFSDAAFDEFADRYAFITLLRDPIDRFLSHYRWWHRPGRVAAAPEPIADFVRTDEALAMGSTYVRYFCGEPGAATFTAKHVDAAIRNLRRLNAVGFLDQLPAFETALRTLTGRRISIGKENVGKVRKVREVETDPALFAQVARACAPDQAVWDAVQDLRGRSARPVQPELSAPISATRVSAAESAAFSRKALPEG